MNQSTKVKTSWTEGRRGLHVDSTNTNAIERMDTIVTNAACTPLLHAKLEFSQSSPEGQFITSKALYMTGMKRIVEEMSRSRLVPWKADRDEP
jgi:hypothetical protein